MGTTSVPFNKHYDCKYDIIERAIGIGDSEYGYTIVARGRTGNNFYYAIRIPKDKVNGMAYLPDDDGSVVYGLTVKTCMHDGDFCYKFMDEFCGPVIHDCPQKVLKALSPLVGTARSTIWAGEWRNDVSDWHDARKLHNQLRKVGVKLLAKKDIPYIGFTLKKGSIVEVVPYYRNYKLLKLNNRTFDLPSRMQEYFELA